jgi:hypothetical protein
MLKKQREKPFFLKQSDVGSADKAPISKAAIVLLATGLSSAFCSNTSHS